MSEAGAPGFPQAPSFPQAIGRHFAFLFTEAGYAVLAANRAEGVEMVGAGSPRCRICFTLQDSAFAILLARPGTPWPFEPQAPAWARFADLKQDADAQRPAAALPDAPAALAGPDGLQAHAKLLRAYLPQLEDVLPPG